MRVSVYCSLLAQDSCPLRHAQTEPYSPSLFAVFCTTTRCFVSAGEARLCILGIHSSWGALEVESSASSHEDFLGGKVCQLKQHFSFLEARLGKRGLINHEPDFIHVTQLVCLCLRRFCFLFEFTSHFHLGSTVRATKKKLIED